MLIDVCSDIHVSKNHLEPNWQYLKNPKSEILIIAGDISNSPSVSRQILTSAACYYQTVLFVDGNHCCYSKMNCEAIEEYYTSISNDNIVYLVDKPFVINNTAFIGVNGWYNFTNEIPTFFNVKAWNRWSNDSKYVGSDKEVLDRAQRDTNRVIQSLDEVSDIVENIVVVTHTAPSASLLTQKDLQGYYNVLLQHENFSEILELFFDIKEPSEMDTYLRMLGEKIPEDTPTRLLSRNKNIKTLLGKQAGSIASKLFFYKRDIIWNLLGSSFCNSLMSTVDTTKVKYWIYGHTHTRQEIAINNTCYINNARGYSNEILQPWKLKTIEV